MVPDLERAIPLQFTDNAIRSRDAVVGGLEYTGNLLGNRNREDEQICYH